MKILVIEDEKPLLEEITEWLTYEGYEVIAAADGIEGVNAANVTSPDMIICDISMPRLDGYGVLLDVRANSALQSIPFIFISAKVDLVNVRIGMQLGADDYLTKPFDRLDLLRAIRTRLDRKNAMDMEYRERINAFKDALQMEHKERLLQAQLVAMFTHDFRNQLAVIVSGALMVRDYGNRLSEERRTERLNTIVDSAHLLVQMLDDMLDIAQMESGSIKLKPESVNLEQFICEIIKEFQSTVSEKKIVNFETNYTDTVQIDVRLLRHIVANLISNAVKYSPSESEIIVLLQKADDKFFLTVEDRGIGIPEDDLAELFQAFHRGSNVGKITGTGLGLAVVKESVDLLGGSIQIESRVGIGTKITVMWPEDEDTFAHMKSS